MPRRRPHPARLLVLIVVLVLLVLPSARRAAVGETLVRRPVDDPEIARAVAASAYVIVDVRSGRRVREQRGEWLDTPVWPGSIAKLATLAAAVDAHTLTARTRIVCTRRVTLTDGRTVDCSHPPLGRALSVVDAIAQSCNVFTASIARTLTRAQLSHGFVQMGLAPLPSGADPIASALGLDGSKVAPHRLIEPILRSATLRRASDARAVDVPAPAVDAPARAADSDTTDPRDLLWKGLRESARTGTSSAFARAGIDALAKTGTAPMRGGRSLGLISAVTPSISPRYAIVLALPGGTGAQAAETAAAILRPFLERDDTIRVGRPTATGYAAETLTLEDYVARVVAGETSRATPLAAREALAITARTYAVVNRGRHAADGFDLCSLTHCQVTRPASVESRAAAVRTRGRLLVCEGRPVPVFYSASCGGTLTDPRVLLPDVDPASVPWLSARPDPAGVDEKTWHVDILARDLLGALQRSGYRGDALRSLTAHAAANDLVTDVVIDGLAPSTLTADEFRRVVGQQLGWHLLKSVRFTVERTAGGYRFTGRGHGHGVGLCVLGASALATRGADARRILDIYFPGLQLTPRQPDASSDATTIRLRLPAADERERARLRRLIDADLRDLTAALDVPRPGSLAVIVHPTGDSYRRATRRPWWTSSATLVESTGITLHLAPLSALDRTARLEQTLRHELVHVLTVRALVNRPRWVHEGLAMHLAGERVSVAPVSASTLECPSDREMMRAQNRAAFDRAYARAAACVARELDAGRSWRNLGVQ